MSGMMLVVPWWFYESGSTYEPFGGSTLSFGACSLQCFAAMWCYLPDFFLGASHGPPVADCATSWAQLKKLAAAFAPCTEEQ